ncbi:hypothetical protein RHAL1_02082 [Beijerinckiaceae bacterium RH AL1]|nr:ATP-grasp domain-containing protein [Beijerinckiaceae bacterium]VVB46034.1 hypothetical protein RHCH11_RHCH11_02040 [Beijerinckiaceae bacterium RH CH11]VVB46115.1 hypothetical protein RHAL8_02036 [Beijerinckiaceae bacterium RH AL8]VVC55168.1 hypothetical protein RHAL1_02082 [Beijerinckiaceae bacterium RH AL1]
MLRSDPRTTMSPSGTPRVLFVSLVNDVASDRIVAAMSKLGAACAVMSAPDAFAARTMHVDCVFPLPRRGGAWARCLVLGRRLKAAQRSFAPDLVVPLDEMAALALRDPKLFARSNAAVRSLLTASLGRPETFALACDRHRIVETAAKLGIPTPQQIAVTGLAEARATGARLGYPLVLKREQTCGGAGVQIVADEAELNAAFLRADAKASRKRRLQALLGRAVGQDSALVLQRFVSGALAFRVVACKDGRVLDGVSFLSERVHPPVTGASTVLQPLERADMDVATKALVAALGCSGFVAVDFLVPTDGPAVLIEMNPRPVASGHLGRLYGHDIHAALLDAVGGSTPRPAIAVAPGPDRIALFPRELDRDPVAARLEPGVLHDVPWNDPGSVAAHATWLAGRHPSSAAHLSQMLGTATPRPRRRQILTDLQEAAARLFHAGGTASAK